MLSARYYAASSAPASGLRTVKPVTTDADGLGIEGRIEALLNLLDQTPVALPPVMMERDTVAA